MGREAQRVIYSANFGKTGEKGLRLKSSALSNPSTHNPLLNPSQQPAASSHRNAFQLPNITQTIFPSHQFHPLFPSSMASISFLQFLIIFWSFFFICHAQISSDPLSSLVLPVTKDYSTFQYLTTLSHGSPLSPTNFVLDLGFSSIWVDCESRRFQSVSGQTISRRSIQCLTAKSRGIESSVDGKVVDQEQACEIFPENRITGKRAGKGELVESLMVLKSAQDSKAS